MEQAEVTEHDREAFAATVEDMGLLSGLTASHIRQGLYDNDCRFIAKARIEATQAKDEEIARLKGALKKIASGWAYPPDGSTEPRYISYERIARQALGVSNG